MEMIKITESLYVKSLARDALPKKFSPTPYTIGKSQIWSIFLKHEQFPCGQEQCL